MLSKGGVERGVETGKNSVAEQQRRSRGVLNWMKTVGESSFTGKFCPFTVHRPMLCRWYDSLINWLREVDCRCWTCNIQCHQTRCRQLLNELRKGRCGLCIRRIGINREHASFWLVSVLGIDWPRWKGVCSWYRQQSQIDARRRERHSRSWEGSMTYFLPNEWLRRC